MRKTIIQCIGVIERTITPILLRKGDHMQKFYYKVFVDGVLEFGEKAYICNWSKQSRIITLTNKENAQLLNKQDMKQVIVQVATMFKKAGIESILMQERKSRNE